MKSIILVLGTIIAMSLAQAATLSSEDEALAAFRAIWKDTLADKLASSSHIVQLRQQVFEEGRVAAQELQSAAC
jgi:hypothetical protein